VKYLIVGLGNIGDKYSDTRHNIGFKVLDTFASASHASFEDKRFGYICRVKHKGRELILLKPSTYMNLSGNAVRYWLNREKIAIENLLVIVDDLALPPGSIRMRRKGSDGGHNGLAHINSVLSTNEYARIRIGIGNEYSKGRQVDYVLGRWTGEEKKFLEERIAIVMEMIKSFCTAGTEITMTAFNKAGRSVQRESPPNNSDNKAPQK
jgi:PTH1 family peptidyl-tRNA hydrolase